MTKKRIIAEDAPVNELLGKLKPAPEQAKQAAKQTTKKTSSPAAARLVVPEGYRLNPEYIEKKTVRVQIVLKPSVAEKLKAHCKKNKLSVNEYIGNLIENDTREK